MVWLRILNENGKYHDGDAINNVLNYCLNSEKTPTALVGGWAVTPENAVAEMSTFSKAACKESGLRLRHFVITFDPKTFHDSEKAFEIAEKCAQYYGDDHQIVYAVHEDKGHVHAHFVMNTVRYTDGKKYRGTQKDLYDFTKYGTNVLHDAGIKSSLAYINSK